ncbi:MAG: lytic murein transglycosylase B [Gammaproteobacteria bacterium]|nr:lytic murein transglycosylase B [Gammaproteobacteria bacterium]MDH3559822.1 lytic murein transglycosylase B [Gammaproteobacteria bacterium]
MECTVILQRILKSAVVLLASLAAMPACTTTTAAPGSPGYIDHPEARAFIDEMAARHDFSRAELTAIFSQAQRREDILELMRRPAEKQLAWHEYRKIFLTQSRIDGGIAYWNQHADILSKAERELGVDAQIIVAIIGVETRYGGNTGSHRVLDALATLAFDYPPRSKFFRGELEQYLVLAHEENIDLLSTKGSYAGAMGYGQFIPSSYRHYAVDFDQDGKRDLWNSPMDIIGSVANYIHEHGWELGATVTLPASVSGDGYNAVLKQGLKPHTAMKQLQQAGITPATPLPDKTLAALITLENKDGPGYWLALNNFYVITRYNRSPLYAMAVYQLSEEIRQARALSLQARHD